MEMEQLFELLELPPVVAKKLNVYREKRKNVMDETTKEMILNRGLWDKGVEKLREAIGEDEDGIKILWEMLNLACDSYIEYEKRNIPMEIYKDTMKFCTRFLEEHYRVYGEYKFVWAWWFPRQLSLQEFRIGSLEYEFVSNDEKIISLHIPSDANLQKEAVAESIHDFFEFRKMFFPDWVDAKIYCESWMLSPALKELMDENSNILQFQNLFIEEKTDYNSMAVLDWVFPGYHAVSEELPENTSLQRKMKRHLLEGGKIGWTTGYVKENV